MYRHRSGEETPARSSRLSTRVTIITGIAIAMPMRTPWTAAWAAMGPIGLPSDFAINLQLLGGVWILQTFPVVVFSLYTRWFHRYALLAGWAVGLAGGSWLGITGRAWTFLGRLGGS